MLPRSISWDADTVAPMGLRQIKSQLRIDHDDFDDLIMNVHLPAAVEWAEGEMHRSILSKVHYWIIDDFPRGIDQSIRLPRGKTQSVASIVYTTNNVATTLTGPSSSSPEGTGYREDLRGSDGGYLYPTASGTWPSVDFDVPAPVLITFSAGWLVAQIPGSIRNALTMYISDALEVTGAVDMTAGMDFSVKERLLSGSRLHRWY